MTKQSEKICESFSQIRWHDSKLLDLHLIRNPEKRQYDLRLNLNLIVGYSEGKIERKMQSALFSDCRIIQTDLDLLGILLCGGDIGAAGCHPDSVELEKRERDKVRQFDLPQNQNPLEECIGFFFEMIPPGGQIIIFAKDFELA
ncbi:MAG: hypothetical protein QOG23_4406 [Blastocatellia bacterium]|jgi:hypothetical protein|nr:hypothetical protein [Blastocatellia bacterium]